MRSKRRRRAASAPMVLPPVDVPGLAYFSQVGAEGLRFFRCEPHHATLSQTGCGTRWRAAQLAPDPDAAGACRSCPLGAAHAGHEHVAYSRLYGAPICPRCRMGNQRIIGDRICVNCYNREREMIAGKNARGNVPTTLLRDRPLHAVELIVIVDGIPRRRRFENVVDRFEAMMQVLRTTKGVISFGFAGSRAATVQRDLFGGAGGGRWTVRRRGGLPRRPQAANDPHPEFWPDLERIAA